MCSLTPDMKAPSSMPPVLTRHTRSQMPRTRIQPCQVHSVIQWSYRQQLIHRSANPWRRLVQTIILYRMMHTLHSVFQSMETFANNVPVASGGTQDDFVCSLHGLICI